VKKNSIVKRIKIILAIIFVFVVFFVIAFPFRMAHLSSMYQQCSFDLFDIRNGIERYIEAKGSLRKLDPYAEATCSYMTIRGYFNKKPCYGMVKKRIDKVCMKGSYKLKKISDIEYEVSAVQKNDKECVICYTESNDKYISYSNRLCKIKPYCWHKNTGTKIQGQIPKEITIRAK